MDAKERARQERVAECIIAICGTFVPGGWAHPGDKCVELVRSELAATIEQAVSEAVLEEAEWWANGSADGVGLRTKEAVRAHWVALRALAHPKTPPVSQEAQSE